jgi:exosome complex component RRP4
MAITILAPTPATTKVQIRDSSDDSDDGGVDLQGDSDMRPTKRFKGSEVVTPGEVVTDDAQWMRCQSSPT